MTVSGLDDINENFVVAGTLNVSSPKLTLPGGNSVSYDTLNGSFTFTTQYLEVKGNAKFAGGLFSGDGYVRINFNPGGEETIPEKYEDPVDARNNATVGGLPLFAPPKVKPQNLELGVAAIDKILSAYNPLRATRSGEARQANAYRDWDKKNTYKLIYNVGDFPYDEVNSDIFIFDHPTYNPGAPEDIGERAFGKVAFHQMIADFTLNRPKSRSREEQLKYIQDSPEGRTINLGIILYEGRKIREQWAADLRALIAASNTARYRGQLYEGDPNNDPDVKRLLKPGQRIDVRTETENSSDASGSQTFIQQTKVYTVYTPSRTTGRRLPEVEGNVNLSLYGGFVTLGANFDLSTKDGFNIAARVKVQVPDNDVIPKPLRGITFGQFEGKLKLALKDGRLDPGASYVDLTARQILFFINKINLNATFDGQIKGFVDIKFIPDISFGPTQLFPNLFGGPKATALEPMQHAFDALPEGPRPRALDAGPTGPLTLEDLQAEDPTVVVVPEVPAGTPTGQITILGVTPTPGTPDAVVTYQVDHPAGGMRVSLFTSLTAGDADFGDEFAADLPAAGGPQQYVWKNLAE